MVLSAIWWVSLGLLAISMIALAVLVIRRKAADQAKTRARERAAELRRFFLAVLRSPLAPDETALLNITPADWPVVMVTALDLLRTITGEDRDRVIAVLRLWKLDRYLSDTVATGDRGRRIQALSLMGHLSDVASFQTLMDCTQDSNIYVQMTALRALSRRGVGEDVDTVIGALHNAAQASPALLADVLKRFGPDAGPALKRLAESDAAEDVRLAAIRALGLLGLISAGPVLSVQLKSYSPEIRCAAIRALARIGDIRFGDGIVLRLGDEEARVRSDAAQAIGKLKLKTALPRLAQLLDDPEWQVRLDAAEAMIQLGPASVAILKARARHSTEGKNGIEAQILAQIGVAA